MKKEEMKIQQFSTPLSKKTRAAFKEFKEKVLGVHSHVDQTLNAIATKQNMKMIRPATILFILTNVYFLLKDILSNFYAEPYAKLNLAAVLLMIIPSCIMLAMTFLTKNHGTKRLRYANLAFYMCIAIAVFLFTVSNTLRANAYYEGANKFVGIAVSTCYIFFLMCAPLPRMSDSLWLLGSSAVLFAFPLSLPRHIPGYSFQQLVVMFIFFVFGYFYLRGFLLKNAKDEIRIRNKNEYLLELAYFDFLTAVFNKRALDAYWKYLTEKTNKPYRIGIILFDIDNFKSYNDNYSHTMGDHILHQVLSHLNEELSDKNKYFFRYGGEEFVMLLIDPKEGETEAYGVKIRDAVYDLGVMRGDLSTHDRVTVSVGCAVINPSSMVENDFIIKSDTQLRLAKASSKNCVAFENRIIS